MKWQGIVLALVVFGTPGFAEDPVDLAAAKRGEQLLHKTSFIKAFWPKVAYENAWKTWGLKQKPVNYAKAFQERYGLHTATYPNQDYPMGLRPASLLLTNGIGIDCMTCHGGSIFGKSYVGLGNSTLDIQSLFDDLTEAAQSPVRTPFTFSQTRGTNEAGAFSVYLLGMRDRNLNIQPQVRDLGLHDDSCEDVPAWWLLKKKRTMYHVGATNSRSVRSLMQFMMHPLTIPEEFHQAEEKFQDIQQYLLSLKAPKYPLPIDESLAKTGQQVFAENCARCHGTYGENSTYPNKIIAINEIGTDRTRYDNIGPKFAEAYNQSWFAWEWPKDQFLPGMFLKPTAGYQAPPLDGIWATAPYFHNGSVPTLADVLKSSTRPKIFTRSFRTDRQDYDAVKVGWKVQDPPRDWETLPAHERRKIYDTTQPGRGNQGHTYGDDLTDAERNAVIEYLKTL